MKFFEFLVFSFSVNSVYSSVAFEQKFWPWSNNPDVPKKPLTPVILVPGDGGSHLEAKLDDRPILGASYCQQNQDWYNLWFNAKSVLPVIGKCMAENLMLRFNATNNTYSNIPGVSIQAPGFGSTDGVDYLDPSKLPPTAYFHAIIAALVNAGYEKDVSLRGAPYDFRYSPNQQGEWMQNITQLVEETYEMNNQSAVSLVAHSLGNIYTWWMLKDKTQEWKDKYIESFISVSAPWGGAPDTVFITASGDNVQIPTLNPLVLREPERTWPSTYALYPNTNIIDANETIIRVVNEGTANKTYSLSNIKSLFTDIDYEEGYEIYLNNKDLLNSVPTTPPGVKTHCIYGIGVETKQGGSYPVSDFPDARPDVFKYVDGDGTVPTKSAELCEEWAVRQKQPVSLQGLWKQSHIGIIKNPNFLNIVKKWLGV